MDPRILDALRLGWFAVFMTLTPVAAWVAKEALLDMWSAAQTPTYDIVDEMPAVEALKHETQGSAWVSVFAFLGLLSGLIAGISSLVQLPVGALIGIIFTGMCLGALTLFEAARRVKVKGALKRRPIIWRHTTSDPESGKQ